MTELAVESTHARSKVFPRMPVTLSFLAFVLIGLNDGAVGVILPSLRAHYNVDKATVGLLFLAGTIGYLIGAFTSGPAVDRLGTRRFLMAGAGIFTLGLATVSTMPPFWMVFVALIGAGLGVAAMDAGLNSYIAQLPNSTALLNYLHAFYGLGALIGPLVASGVLAAEWRWNTVYFFWIGIGLLLTVSFPLIFKGRSPAAHGTAIPGSNVLAAALKLRLVWVMAFFLLVYVGAEVSLGTWGYSFLTEERHEPELFSGWVISGYWLGLTLGRALLARVAQRIGNRRMIELCLAGTCVGVLLVWLVPVGTVSAFGLWLAGFSLGPIYPTSIALVSQLVPKRILPSSIGFVSSFGAMGAALFPWLAGILAEAAGLWSLLPYVVILSALMLVLWTLLQAGQRSSPVPEDAEAVP